mmetsp:Transcript_39102/g.77094  ORF Transcript_39102/g.77094 Transcript_39102/m.77094 type:complete len:205 (+) Transcript_39102:248-862(+)
MSFDLVLHTPPSIESSSSSSSAFGAAAGAAAGAAVDCAVGCAVESAVVVAHAHQRKRKLKRVVNSVGGRERRRSRLVVVATAGLPPRPGLGSELPGVRQTYGPARRVHHPQRHLQRRPRGGHKRRVVAAVRSLFVSVNRASPPCLFFLFVFFPLAVLRRLWWHNAVPVGPIRNVGLEPPAARATVIDACGSAPPTAGHLSMVRL